MKFSWIPIVVNCVMILMLVVFNFKYYEFIKYDKELNSRIEDNIYTAEVVESKVPEINYDELVELSEEVLNVSKANKIEPDLKDGSLYDAIVATRSNTMYSTPSYFSKIDSKSNVLFITNNRFKQIRKSARLDFDMDLINCNTHNINDMYELVKELDMSKYKQVVLSPTLCYGNSTKYYNVISKLVYHILYSSKNKPKLLYIKSNIRDNIQNVIEDGYEQLNDRDVMLIDIQGLFKEVYTKEGYCFDSTSTAISAMEYIFSKV